MAWFRTYLLSISLLFYSINSVAQLDFIPEEWSLKSEIRNQKSEKVDSEKKSRPQSSASTSSNNSTSRIDTIILHDTVWVQQADTLVADTTESSVLDEAAENTGINKLSKIVSWPKVFWGIVFLIFSYFVIRFLVFVVETFAEKSTKYRFILKSIPPFIKILGWIIAIFVLIQGIFQPPTEAIYAALASVGIAIGFAAQDILKNIFGGIMILFDRPFQLGDKIQIGEDYGEVKEIGLRSTRIVTKDDSLISIPNAEVVNKAVSNSNSGEANCQVVAEIYLPIDVDTNKVRQLALEAARVSRYVYLNKPIVVLFINEVKQRRSYLKMRLKAYVSDIRYEFSFQSDMTEIVMRELLEQGLINKEDIS
ncbi:MAG: mechanosensitive ion channel protein MscS [Flavobacteriales bacterium]|nr:mechanosensitive ion channel protein MscS [Flavobacteriales bacterium]